MDTFVRYALRQFKVARQYPNGYVETVTVWAEIDHEARLIATLPGIGQSCSVLSVERINQGVIAKIQSERITTETPVFIFPSPAA
jgi:hypothetical protein